MFTINTQEGGKFGVNFWSVKSIYTGTTETKNTENCANARLYNLLSIQQEVYK